MLYNICICIRLAGRHQGQSLVRQPSQLRCLRSCVCHSRDKQQAASVDWASTMDELNESEHSYDDVDGEPWQVQRSKRRRRSKSNQHQRQHVAEAGRYSVPSSNVLNSRQPSLSNHPDRLIKDHLRREPRLAMMTFVVTAIINSIDDSSSSSSRGLQVESRLLLSVGRTQLTVKSRLPDRMLLNLSIVWIM